MKSMRGRRRRFVSAGGRVLTHKAMRKDGGMVMNRRHGTLGTVSLIALAALIAFALAGCAGSGSTTGGGYGTPAETPATEAPASESPSTGGTKIIERGMSFVPDTLDVKVGDTVTFRNEDTVPHQVSVDGQDLGIQPSGADVSWTASTAGTFDVVCLIHPSMAAQITVAP